MAQPVHTPVMVRETLEGLRVQPGGRYIDGTVGGGGHAAAILEKSSPGGQLLGIDTDPAAIAVARKRLIDYTGTFLLVNDNFANLEAICTKYGYIPVHGILLDLGLSSLQLQSGERGFSFQYDAPLDMRFNPTQQVSAADIVNTSPEDELAGIIWKYGEESASRQIARHIMKKRPIRTTLELSDVVTLALGGRRGKIHPATRTFQALRIAVNQELVSLEAALKQAVDILGIEGRLVVVSYHSLEDRIVKQFFQRESRDCICPPETPVCVCHHKARLKTIAKKVIIPSPEEIRANPRSRSAKMRVAERKVSADELFGILEEHRFSTGHAEWGWRRPALAEKLRKTFLAVQVDTF